MDEKTLNLTQDARLINANENLIFPRLDEMLQGRLMRMVGNFNGGSRDFVADAAYMAALVELRESLKQTQNKGNSALAKMINTKES